MCCKGLLKRLLPFFVTFAVGLFIASFFVSIAAPRFNGFNRGGKRHSEYNRLKAENERLRAEIERLKMEVADRELRRVDTVPAFEMDSDIPPPPPPPARIRVHKTK